MPFDPDQFLEKNATAQTPAPQSKQGFDPDQFLKTSENTASSGANIELSPSEKMELALKRINIPDLSQEDRANAERDFIKSYADRAMTTNTLQRVKAATPSGGQLLEAGKQIAGTVAEAPSKGLMEYFNNPPAAIIAGMGGIAKGAAELGRFGYNVITGAGREGAQVYAKATDDRKMAEDLARNELDKINLNREFDKAAEKFTEATYGKEAPTFAGTGEQVGQFVVPAGKILGTIGRTAEAASDVAKAAESAALLAKTSKLQPGLLPQNVGSVIGGLASGGIREAAEVNVANKLNKLAQVREQLRVLRPDLSADELFAREMDALDDVANAQKWARRADTATNVYRYARDNGLAIGTGTLGGTILGGAGTAQPGEATEKGAAGGGAVGGMFGASNLLRGKSVDLGLEGSSWKDLLKKDSDKKIYDEDFVVPSPVGEGPGSKSASSRVSIDPATLAENVSEAFNQTVRDMFRDNVEGTFGPGQPINRDSLYRTAIARANGQDAQPEAATPVENPTGIKLGIDPAVNPPEKAPDAGALSESVANSVRNPTYGGSSAPVNPKWNRYDIATGNIIGSQGQFIAETPQGGGQRSKGILAAREQRGENVGRSERDSVMGYGYHPESRTLYVHFDGETMHDRIGSGGVSQYAYQIGPEHFKDFSESANKQAWLNNQLLKIPDATGVRIYTSPSELAEAARLYKQGKITLATGGQPRTTPPSSPEGGQPAPTQPPTAPAPASAAAAVPSSAPAAQATTPAQRQQLLGKQSSATALEKADQRATAQAGEQMTPTSVETYPAAPEGYATAEQLRSEQAQRERVGNFTKEVGEAARSQERSLAEEGESTRMQAEAEAEQARRMDAEEQKAYEAEKKAQEEKAGREERTRAMLEEEARKNRMNQEDYASELVSEIASLTGLPYESIVKTRRFHDDIESWIGSLEARFEQEIRQKKEAESRPRTQGELAAADIATERERKTSRYEDVKAALADRKAEVEAERAKQQAKDERSAAKKERDFEELKKRYGRMEKESERKKRWEEEGRVSLRSFRKEKGVEFPPSEETLAKENLAQTETKEKVPEVPFEEAVTVPQGKTVKDAKRMSQRMREIDAQLLGRVSDDKRVDLLKERLELAADLGNERAKKALLKWNEGPDKKWEFYNDVRKLVDEKGIISDRNYKNIGEVDELRENIGTRPGRFKKQGMDLDALGRSVTQKAIDAGLMMEGAAWDINSTMNFIQDAFAAPRTREPELIGEPPLPGREVKTPEPKPKRERTEEQGMTIKQQRLENKRAAIKEELKKGKPLAAQPAEAPKKKALETLAEQKTTEPAKQFVETIYSQALNKLTKIASSDEPMSNAAVQGTASAIKKSGAITQQQLDSIKAIKSPTKAFDALKKMINDNSES